MLMHYWIVVRTPGADTHVFAVDAARAEAEAAAYLSAWDPAAHAGQTITMGYALAVVYGAYAQRAMAEAGAPADADPFSGWECALMSLPLHPSITEGAIMHWSGGTPALAGQE